MTLRQTCGGVASPVSLVFVCVCVCVFVGARSAPGRRLFSGERVPFKFNWSTEEMMHPPAAVLQPPDPDVVTDDTLIVDACKVLAKKLPNIPDMKSKSEQLCAVFEARGCFLVGALKSMGFTVTQIDEMCAQAELPNVRPTLEYIWHFRAQAVSLPDGMTPPDWTKDRQWGGVRESRYLRKGDLTLGLHLRKIGALGRVRLSPRLSSIVTPKSMITPREFDLIVNECALFTFARYSKVNVDAIYLAEIERLLTAFYPSIPDSKKSFAASIMSKLHNCCKSKPTSVCFPPASRTAAARTAAARAAAARAAAARAAAARAAVVLGIPSIG